MAQQRSTTTIPVPSAGDGGSLLTPARGPETIARVPGTAAAPPTGPLGRVVAASMATGVVAAGALTFAVLPSAPEATIVGAALIAFAAGWAMLGRLSTRLTTRPQRWTYVPAAVMTASGAALVAFTPGEPIMTHLAWACCRSDAGHAGRCRWLPAAPRLRRHRQPDRRPAERPRSDLSSMGAHQPVIARTTRVCAYDRAGQGWSEDSPHPADAVNAAADLHRLLAAAGESGPYVLAGHSSGGVHALTYAARYPHDMSGMVLLDSASPHQMDLVTSFDAEYQLLRRALALAPTLFRFGIGHITQAAAAATLPGQAAEQTAVFANSPRGMRAARAEQIVLPETFRQAQALTTLGTTPLVVLTAQDNVDHRQGWGAAQDRLAALSSNSRHTVADLDHMAFLLDPSGSALSIDAITDVVAAARNHTRLRTP